MVNCKSRRGICLDNKEKNEEYHVTVEPDKDLQDWYHSRIIIPIKTYERFIAIANNDPIWTDGYTLYSFLYYCSRLQKTDKPWVNKNYIKKVLHWGQERVYKTLKWLDEDVDVIDISENQNKYKDG